MPRFSSIFLPFLVKQIQKHKHKLIFRKNTNTKTNPATDLSCQPNAKTTNTNLNISKNANPAIHLQQTQMQTQQTNTNPNMIPPTHPILQELSISDHWLKKKKSTFCCWRFKTASSDMTYWGIFFF